MRADVSRRSKGLPTAPTGGPGTVPRMRTLARVSRSPLFTWHQNLLRPVVGGLILAVVLLVQASGYQPLWPVVVITFIVAVGSAVLIARIPAARNWLRG